MLNDVEQSQLKKFLSKFVRDVTGESGIDVLVLEGDTLLPTVMKMDKNLTELSFDVYTEGISNFTDDWRDIPSYSRGTFIDSFIFAVRSLHEIILDDTLAEVCPELLKKGLINSSFQIVDNQHRKMVIVCRSEQEKREYVSAIALFRLAPRGQGGYYYNGVNKSANNNDDGCSSASCRVQANIRKVLAQQEEEQRKFATRNSKLTDEDNGGDTAVPTRDDNTPGYLCSTGGGGSSTEREIPFAEYHHTYKLLGSDTENKDDQQLRLQQRQLSYFKTNKVKSISGIRNAAKTSIRHMNSLIETPTFHALSSKPQGTGLGLKGPGNNNVRSVSSLRQVSCCNDPCRGCNRDQTTLQPSELVPLPSPGFSLPIMPTEENHNTHGATPLVHPMDHPLEYSSSNLTTQQRNHHAEQFEQSIMFGRSAPSTSTRYFSSPLHYYPPSVSSNSSHSIQQYTQKEGFFPVRNTVIPVFDGDEQLHSRHNVGFGGEVVPKLTLPPVSPFNQNAPYNFRYDINGYITVRGHHTPPQRPNFFTRRSPLLEEEEEENGVQYEGVYTDETVDGEEHVNQQLQQQGGHAPSSLALIRSTRKNLYTTTASETSDTSTTIEEAEEDDISPPPPPQDKNDSSNSRPVEEEPIPYNIRLQSIESVNAAKLCWLNEPNTPFDATQQHRLTSDDFTPPANNNNNHRHSSARRSFSEFFGQENLTETTWLPQVTNRENTLTLLNGEDQVTDSCVKDLHRQQALKMLQNDDNFSISPSEIGCDIDFKKAHQHEQHRRQEIIGRSAILAGPDILQPNSHTSSLMENKPWQQNLDSMSPLEKLRKAAKYGTPTPFTQIQYKRLEEETSVTNMSTRWTRHER